MRAIFFESDDAEAVAARLRADGYAANVERERLQGEDDDEDHPWAVVTDAPEFALEILSDAHEGWLDAGESAAPRTGVPLDLPTAPQRIKRPQAQRTCKKAAASTRAGVESITAGLRSDPVSEPLSAPVSEPVNEPVRDLSEPGTILVTPSTHAQRLLLVHAHPDDESISNAATMAKYVAEGRGVTLVTCTAGEMGEILVPELEHLAADQDDGLGEHRRGELADAMKQLGVTDHRYLGGFGRYRDSGMKWHADGHAIAADETDERAFANADLTQAADHLVEIIRSVRPQVLVIYDQFGGYGHPDHIQAHRVATYAADLAAVPSYRRDLGEPYEVAKVYWTAMSQSWMREGLRRLRDAGDTTTFDGIDPDDPIPFGSPDEDLAAAVDASEYADAKVAAMRAHATQITVDGPFFALSNNLGNAVWGVEHYRLAKGTPGPLDANGLETDLFAGLA